MNSKQLVLILLAEALECDLDVLTHVINLVDCNDKLNRIEDYQHPRCEVFSKLVTKFQNEDFRKHFRVDKVQFEILYQKLAVLRNGRISPIPLEKKMLITLWVLAKPECFLAVGARFGVSHSTAYIVYKETIRIIKKMISMYIKLPEGLDLLKISKNFKHKSSGIWGTCGAINGSHTAIKQPKHNAVDYYNRKNFHSVILQGICDNKGIFTNIFVVMPGRMHDANVYARSGIGPIISRDCNSLWPPKYHLIGDCAYPHSEHLLTPFKDNGHLSPAQIRFNCCISKARSVIERAFGLLKNRWRRLYYLDMCDHNFICEVISAACILHNFILIEEDRNDDGISCEDESDCDSVLHKRDYFCSILTSQS